MGPFGNRFFEQQEGAKCNLFGKPMFQESDLDMEERMLADEVYAAHLAEEERGGGKNYYKPGCHFHTI